MVHKHRYAHPVSDVTQNAMTIDELARRTGMTVRNIRAHQSRGLVSAPEVRGRTGYYGDEHVARIELIREMQAEGLNLAAIRRMLEGAGDSSSEIVETREGSAAQPGSPETRSLTAPARSR